MRQIENLINGADNFVKILLLNLTASAGETPHGPCSPMPNRPKGEFNGIRGTKTLSRLNTDHKGFLHHDPSPKL